MNSSKFAVVSLTAAAIFQGLVPGSTMAEAVTGYGASVDKEEAAPDIIVTAQRREQSVQDVPIAVAVVSNEMLSANNALGTFDLPRAVPGLQASQIGTAFLPFLRGVGSSQPNPRSYGVTLGITY